MHKLYIKNCNKTILRFDKGLREMYTNLTRNKRIEFLTEFYNCIRFMHCARAVCSTYTLSNRVIISSLLPHIQPNTCEPVPLV